MTTASFGRFWSGLDMAPVEFKQLFSNGFSVEAVDGNLSGIKTQRVEVALVSDGIADQVAQLVRFPENDAVPVF